MTWHPADGWIIGIAIPAALFFFARAVYLRYRLMLACAPAPDTIADHGARLKELLTIFLGQKKLFQDLLPGVMHAVIFWGFCVLSLRTITMFGMAFAGFDFYLPGFAPGTLAGNFLSLFKDAAVIMVSVMVIFALVRRYVLKVPRLLNTPAALFVLLMILGLMITDILFDAGLSGGVSSFTGHAAFLLHCLGILVFLVYLPMGKHMHIITSLFNVYLRPFYRSGRLTKLPLEDESVETFGTPRIEDLSWKEALDLYTCTECGRCTDMCPAAQTDKKLSPRDVINKQKHFLVDDEAPRLLSGDKTKEPSKEMVPDVIAAQEAWDCTTCQACEQACPLNISHVQRINSMRRSEVLMKGQFPAELKRVFKGLQTNSNPWGMGADKRLEWAKGMDLPLLEKNPGAEYLLYLGCNAAFDDRAQKVSRSLAGLLKEQGVSFAVLGESEACCGETARRLGEEAVGQALIEANIKLFNDLKVKKIVTPCPHCYNTLKNEYSDFGGTYEVSHHSQLISELMESGRLPAPAKQSGGSAEQCGGKQPGGSARQTQRASAGLADAFGGKPGGNTPGRAVIHDSCYLGRVNSMYRPSRDILKGISGLEVVEHEKSGEHGFCCGAGGGRFWLEEAEPRINHARVKQLLETKPSIIATSCPYCLKMLSDGVKDLGGAGVEVRDLAEIVSAHPGS
ncbi:MAG: 4Fe-4S dicluster domain-containing protein [Elusimicrobia bacterium]|nr:4Fe-4S dicluster domain-containing protein [Elusimicrobiota bacterium]